MVRSGRGEILYRVLQGPIDHFLLSNWEVVGAHVLKHLRTSPVILTLVFNLLRECARATASSAAAIPRLKVLPTCRYGAQCYRMSESHRKKYFHPQPAGDSEDASQALREAEIDREVPRIPPWVEAGKDSLTEQLCNSLGDLVSWARDDASESDKEKLCDLLRALLALDPYRVLQSGSTSRTFLITTAGMLLGKSSPLRVKIMAMNFLGPVLKLSGVEVILDALKTMCVFDFPSRSTDVVYGTPAFVDYVEAIDAMFRLLCESRNLRLLVMLFPVIREDKHVHERAINTHTQIFVKTCVSDYDTGKALFKLVLDTLMDPSQPWELQWALMTKFVIPLLTGAQPDLVLDLFRDHVRMLMDIIKKNIGGGTASSPAEIGGASPAKKHAHAPLFTIEQELNMKICAMNLVSEFYALVPLQNIKVDITKAYINDPKKDVQGKGTKP